MPFSMTVTLPLNTKDNHLEVVGGKGRSLSKLIQAGFRVPNGFHIPIETYRQFVIDNNIQERILALAKPCISKGLLSFEQASADIGKLFQDCEMTAEQRDAITKAYHNLAEKSVVAVRSSANAEDLPDLSFAGQQETFLNVYGATEVIDAVKRCWASLWTSQAMNYRHEMSIAHSDVAMCVVVQEMVASEVSGIIFTANPVTGDRSEMIANSSFGLGESVVSGQVTPDTYTVNRENFDATEIAIGEKAVQIVSAVGQGTHLEEVAKNQRGLSSLSEANITELAKTAIRVESLFKGIPQDIEWAFASDQLFLLQSRPITNLPLPKAECDWPEIPGAQLYKRMASEVMPEPLSPLFEDLYLKGLYDTQTWPNDWEWKGSFTRNYLSNFIIATVNGYAFQAIYIAQGDEARAYWSSVQAEHAKLPWYRTMVDVFKVPQPEDLDRVDVNNSGGAARMRLLFAIKDTPQRWIWYLYQWSRAFIKSEAVTRWHNRNLPHYLSRVKYWGGTDPSELSEQTLLDGIRALASAEARYWHVLRAIIGAAKITDQMLHNFLISNAPDLKVSSGTFLSGFESDTLVAETEMRAIAEEIRSNRAIHDLIILTPIGSFLEKLKHHPGGSSVLRAINQYLETYGKQVFNLDFVEPSLIEAPLPFLTNLKAMVRHSGFDLSERQRQVKTKRRRKWLQTLHYFLFRKTKEVKEGWAGSAPVSRWAFAEFIRLYLTAKINYPTREKAIFYMGLAWSVLRPFSLELGRRLIEVGTLRKETDIFYLTNDQLQQAVDALGNNQNLPSLRDQAKDQYNLREWRKRLDQPAAIPEENQLSWVGNDKSFDTIKINTKEAEIISGFAVSPGTTRGIASVIMSPDEFDRMQPDTILVCPLTTPAWTQLFPYASALVTDIGSITAHGSIVAREFGIPAVLGTGNATRLIKHGQEIEVDGDTGKVTLV